MELSVYVSILQNNETSLIWDHFHTQGYPY